MSKNKLIILIAIIPIIGYFIIFNQVTEPVAIHFNLNGEADQYGSKYWYLALSALPLIVASIKLVFGRYLINEENKKYVNSIIIMIVLSLSLIMMLVMISARNSLFTLGSILIVIIGGLLIYLGNIMNKLEPNKWVGIRMKATLNSKQVWYYTHRRGGWLLTLHGLMCVIIGLIFIEHPEYAFIYFILGLILIMIHIYYIANKKFKQEKRKLNKE